MSDEKAPLYLSFHSAEVILSDVRPLKLKVDALQLINAFLDELLLKVLDYSKSLQTEKLRIGLLRLVPTSLGKAAVLEAEIELKAYTDRAGPTSSKYADDKSFRLQWAFELMRLKCEAYSTLNDSEEDTNVEARLSEKILRAGDEPPSAALVAPASLYLTAVLEWMCEHILSNVGRVASRDSSRATVTIQDLFIALCEDHAIYDTAKGFKVFEQLEALSKPVKHRKSKSLSRNEKLPSLDRSDSPQYNGRNSPKRYSSDTISYAQSIPREKLSPSASRTSSEKTRKKKLFPSSGSRSSQDKDRSDRGHGDSSSRPESGMSEDARQAWAAYTDSDKDEDTSALQEFDDLMRSDAPTMKVSLTPDRLRTMEVYKQEQRRGTRHAPITSPLKATDSPSSLSLRSNNRRPPLPNVDSITEDDEDAADALSTKSPRSRLTSLDVPTVPTPSYSSAQLNRFRSASVAGHSSPSSTLSRNHSGGNLSFKNTTMPPPQSTSNFQRKGIPAGLELDNQFPAKTRKIQRNRESLDLDDIMAGSDDENDDTPPTTAVPQTPKTPKTGSTRQVSSRTNELMDFLNEGPPEPVLKASKSSRDLIDFLASAPPDYGLPPPPPISAEPARKSSGRLQRMMSKLSMSSSDKAHKNSTSSDKLPQDDSKFRGTANGSSFAQMPIAPKPVPPRPTPISPPTPPSQDVSDSYTSSASSRSRKISVSRRTAAPWEAHDSSEPPVPQVPTRKRSQVSFSPQVTPPPAPSPNGLVSSKSVISPTSLVSPISVKNSISSDFTQEEPSPTRVTRVPVRYAKAGLVRSAHPSKDELVSPVSERSISTPLPSNKPSSVSSEPIHSPTPTKDIQPQPSSDFTRPAAINTSPPTGPAEIRPLQQPSLSAEMVQAMRRTMLHATSADECRIIFDLFLARAGISYETPQFDNPYPSPSLSEDNHGDSQVNNLLANKNSMLEHSLVETLLGGNTSQALTPQKRQTKPTPVKPIPDVGPVHTPRAVDNVHTTTGHSRRGQEQEQRSAVLITV